jgi:signal transduction histidine kinase
MATSRARVNLRKDGDRLLLSVCDEGRDFDNKELGSKVGSGIPSMGERVRLLGGQFEIQSEPGKGTRIEVSVPSQHETGL